MATPSREGINLIVKAYQYHGKSPSYSGEGAWEIATTSREVNSRLGEGYHTKGKYQ